MVHEDVYKTHSVESDGLIGHECILLQFDEQLVRPAEVLLHQRMIDSFDTFGNWLSNLSPLPEIKTPRTEIMTHFEAFSKRYTHIMELSDAINISNYFFKGMREFRAISDVEKVSLGTVSAAHAHRFQRDIKYKANAVGESVNRLRENMGIVLSYINDLELKHGSKATWLQNVNSKNQFVFMQLFEQPGFESVREYSIDDIAMYLVGVLEKSIKDNREGYDKIVGAKESKIVRISTPEDLKFLELKENQIWHDSKNPLTPIKGYSQMILNKDNINLYVDEVRDNLQVSLNKLQFVSDYMYQLIPMEFQMIPVTQIEIQARNILSHIVNIHQIKEMNIHIDHQDLDDQQVLFAAPILNTFIVNCMDNAADSFIELLRGAETLTEPLEIRYSSGYFIDSDGQKWLDIVITDNAKGIDESFIPPELVIKKDTAMDRDVLLQTLVHLQFGSFLNGVSKTTSRKGNGVAMFQLTEMLKLIDGKIVPLRRLDGKRGTEVHLMVKVG